MTRDSIGAERREVRLSLSQPPTPAQLRGLRAAFPQLARIPLAALRRHLTDWPVFKVGIFKVDELSGEQVSAQSEALVASMETLGVGIELFGYGDYAAHIREVMPTSAPSWATSTRRLELLFLPSFEPEGRLRLWWHNDMACHELSTFQTSLWQRRFCKPPWLFARDSSAFSVSVAPERPHVEQVAGPWTDGLALLSSARSLESAPAATGVAMVDGTTVHLNGRYDAETFAHRVERDGRTRADELVWQFLRLFQQRLRTPESQHQLALLLAAF